MPQDRALDAAQAFHLQGRLDEAETLYRSVLQRHPDSVRAIEGLGVLAYQFGRVDEAANLFAHGVEIRPDVAGFHANLGEALRMLKRFDEAAGHVRRAVELDPALPDAWNTRGLVAHDQRRYADAESAYREAIRLRPRFAAAYLNLGNALWESGRTRDAVDAVREALRIEPDNPGALTNLGRFLIEMEDHGLLEEAESLCRRALALSPRFPQAANNLGNICRRLGRLDEAMACYRRALEWDPRRVTPRHNLGRLLQERGRFEEAARSYEEAEVLEPDPARLHANFASMASERGDHDEAARRYRLALAIDPDSADIHHGLGMALLESGRLDDAEAAFHEAIRIKPTRAVPWLELARLQSECGDLDAACQSARKALTLRPNFAEAYCLLANILKGRLPDADYQSMRGLIEQKSLNDHVRARLHFAVAAVVDDRGLDSEAATLLEAANAFQAADWSAKGRAYDPHPHSLFIGRIMAAFTPEFLAQGRDWGDPDGRPVFVVGLPRSGTTLTEQILASHREVHGTGELPDVHRVFEGLPEGVGRPGDDPFEALGALGPAESKVAARKYLDRLETLAPPTAARIVDKMPDNIHYLGLIARLWPGARVIVCSRDVRDIAVSCWRTGFATVRWANDPDHIARRLVDYRRVLDHWRMSQPLAWLDVSYEDLVHNPEDQARRMIEFLGLEWDPACLESHTKRRVVRTASWTEVRQPIHARSVGRGRRFEAIFPRLFQALERHGIA